MCAAGDVRARSGMRKDNGLARMKRDGSEQGNRRKRACQLRARGRVEDDGGAGRPGGEPDLPASFGGEHNDRRE